MKIATIIARTLLGLIFVVFGSNMFLHFIPMPPPPEGPARDFMTALFVSHYLYVVGALQVVGGLLLFTGRWVPLGLALVGPVIVMLSRIDGAIRLADGNHRVSPRRVPALASSWKLCRSGQSACRPRRYARSTNRGGGFNRPFLIDDWRRS